MNRRQILFAGGAVAGAGLAAAALSIARTGTMEDYDAATVAMRARLPERPDLADFIRLATLAPNGHNTQPWQFHLTEGRIDIRPDFRRRTPAVDPDDHHLFVSLGCAAENLALAAAAGGQHGEPRFDSQGDGSLVFEFVKGGSQPSPLTEAITRRQSTRVDYDGRAVAPSDLEILAGAARLPGVELILLIDRPRIEPLVEMVLAGNSAQMADATFLHELKHWLRFNPRQALETRDGLFSATTGNPTMPGWLGGMMFDMAFHVGAENDKYARRLRSSAGVAVFVSERDDKEHWARSGRASQRFALQATALGLKHAFVNQAVEVASVRRQLATYLGVGSRRPDLVMRFGYGPEVAKSLRRPVEQLIIPALAA